MCSGGRIVNYLKALIEDECIDILFSGYQAQGTLGRVIQHYGPRHGGFWLRLVHTIFGAIALHGRTRIGIAGLCVQIGHQVVQVGNGHYR